MLSMIDTTMNFFFFFFSRIGKRKGFGNITYDPLVFVVFVDSNLILRDEIGSFKNVFIKVNIKYN